MRWRPKASANRSCATTCAQSSRVRSTTSTSTATWEHHLPGNLNMSFVYVEGESLLMGSTTSPSVRARLARRRRWEPSYVLKALGLGDDVATRSIRFGLGRFNTRAEVDYVADKIIDVVKKLRELSPLYEMVQEGIDLTKIEWAAH